MILTRNPNPTLKETHTKGITIRSRIKSMKTALREKGAAEMSGLRTGLQGPDVLRQASPVLLTVWSVIELDGIVVIRDHDTVLRIRLGKTRQGVLG